MIQLSSFQFQTYSDSSNKFLSRQVHKKAEIKQDSGAWVFTYKWKYIWIK